MMSVQKSLFLFISQNYEIYTIQFTGNEEFPAFILSIVLAQLNPIILHVF
jgi:hypothetical protein